jgi:hypothetical protein
LTATLKIRRDVLYVYDTIDDTVQYICFWDGEVGAVRVGEPGQDNIYFVYTWGPPSPEHDRNLLQNIFSMKIYYDTHIYSYKGL